MGEEGWGGGGGVCELWHRNIDKHEQKLYTIIISADCALLRKKMSDCLTDDDDTML